MYKQKIEGEICSDCGKAKYVKSPKSGKIFCADKCWLTGEVQQAPQSQQAQRVPLPPTRPQGFEQELTKDALDLKEREKIMGMIRTNMASSWIASGRTFNAAAIGECELAVVYAIDGVTARPVAVLTSAQPKEPFIERIKHDPKYQDPKQPPLVSVPKSPTLAEQHKAGEEFFDSLAKTQ